MDPDMQNSQKTNKKWKLVNKKNALKEIKS